MCFACHFRVLFLYLRSISLSNMTVNAECHEILKYALVKCVWQCNSLSFSFTEMLPFFFSHPFHASSTRVGMGLESVYSDYKGPELKSSMFGSSCDIYKTSSDFTSTWPYKYHLRSNHTVSDGLQSGVSCVCVCDEHAVRVL